MNDDSPRSRIRRLFVLLCGFEILPKTVSTRGRGGRFILSEPVCAYLLDTDSGWVLLDAGLNPDNGRDPVRRQQKFWQLGMTAPVIRDEHLLESQLAALGVGLTDIGHVILSHLHYDHCGCLQYFSPAKAAATPRPCVPFSGSRHSRQPAAQPDCCFMILWRSRRCGSVRTATGDLVCASIRNRTYERSIFSLVAQPSRS